MNYEKDVVQLLNKTWVALIDELSSFNKKEMSEVKDFLSKQQDTCRMPYHRETSDYKRHCVFIGSVNDATFLRDSTSPTERRFWIIKCNKTTKDGTIFQTMTPDYVDQLWAEVVTSYKENPDEYLDIPDNLQDDFAKEQAQFKTYNGNVNLDMIMDILNREYYVDEKGCFDSIDDYIAQVKGESFPTQNKRHKRIYRLPKAYLVQALRTYGIKCTRNEMMGLFQGLRDGWTIEDKTANYNGNSCWGLLVRVEPKPEEDNLF